MSKLLNISDLSNVLGLVDPKTNKPLNYIIRFWETKFKQIKPKIINKRRYYTEDHVKTIKLIKFLIKDKGMTINGVKTVLNSKINKLDEYDSDSLKADYYKNNLKVKSRQILNKLQNLKKYGKKNSS
tara:strand:+ start:170 stop:550 length:381 start_codon:yes stop_codon:yes gene_type:complete